ncbi:MAG: hemolysin family protein [Chloroflexota bacterium]
MNLSLADVVLRVIGVLCLLVANAFFVATEYATVSARRGRIDQLVEDGASGARRAQRLLNDKDRTIAATQLGITMCSLALGWVGEPFVADLLVPLVSLLPANPWIDRETLAHTISALIAFAVITSLHIVIGEQTPKVWALRNAERVAVLSAPLLLGFDKIFRPLTIMLDAATSAVLKLAGVPSLSGHRTIHSIEDLKRLVSDSQEGGVLEASEEEMIHNVFEFADRQVSEAMVPRPDIVGIESNATIADFLTCFAESRHSRYPIYEENLDKITGFVTIKDVLNFMASEGPGSRQKLITPLVRPALFVPEFKHIGDLFAEMKTQGIPFAVIVDEYGGTAGMVTQGGILEVIVGRMRDETAPEEPEVSQLDERTAEVDAQLRIEEVNQELETHLPEHDAYETLAGLILFKLQRIPVVGDHLLLDNVKLTVKEMHSAKIEKVEVKRMDAAKAAGEIPNPAQASKVPSPES